MRATLYLLTACCTLGCGGISGSVDGRDVGGARDALFDRYELFGIDVALLWVTDAPNSCELFDEVYEVGGDCNERCDELNQIAQTYLTGDEQWTLATTIRIDGDAEGTYTHDTSFGVDTFVGDFFWWDVSLWQDVDRCVDECEEWDALTGSDAEPVSSGELLIDDANDDVLSGELDLEFDDGGVLTGSFSANRCDMADWLQ